MSGGLIAPLVALASIAAFALTGPRIAQRTPPQVAAWVLAAGASVAAVAGALLLAVLSLPLVGQDDTLADEAHWSAAVLARDSLVGRTVASGALALLAVLLVRTWREARAQRRGVVAARRVRTAVGCVAGDLVVLPESRVDIFALAGRPGLIVATEGLLCTLPADERRAVLAHERSHLAHRHHMYVGLGHLAAALNPLLWRVPVTLRYLVERWADEDAARATSRPTTAGALDRVARACEPRHPLSALAAAVSGVARRIAALESAPLPMRPALVMTPGVLAAIAVVAALVATDHVWDVFRVAMAAEHHVLLHRR